MRRLSRQSDRALLGIGTAGVLEQDAERRIGAAEELIGSGGLLDREAVRDQRLGAQCPCIQGMEHGQKLRCSVQRTKPMG